MAVELGEGSPAEQAAIASIISDYSFHDASVGVVSLLASIYYFSYLARNDVNVLTLLAVAVVAGLNQEVRWAAFVRTFRFSRAALQPLKCEFCTIWVHCIYLYCVWGAGVGERGDVLAPSLQLLAQSSPVQSSPIEPRLDFFLWGLHEIMLRLARGVCGAGGV